MTETTKEPSLFDAFWDLSSANEEIMKLSAAIAEQREKYAAATKAAVGLMEQGKPYLYTRSYATWVITSDGTDVQMVEAVPVKY